MAIIAQGGFNTGRLYSTEGQRVFWWVDDDAIITFYDLDRMICGTLHKQEYPQFLTPTWIMAEYDSHRYDMAVTMMSIPEGFEFGPALRI